MNQTATLGINLTGVAVAPKRIEEMLSGMEEFPPTSVGDAQDIANVRIAYAKEAEPIGSVPSPTGLKSTLQTAVKAVTGGQPTLFLDKLGERLAFERTGVRLYEALLSKYDAFGSFSGGPSREDLVEVFEDEYEHFVMLSGAITQLGGDPTAVTPSANLQATVSQGIPQVLADPRVTLLQSLEAMLVTELTDNACWEALSELAAIANENELTAKFEQAYETEQEHLEKVRAWIAAGQGRAQDRNGDS